MKPTLPAHLGVILFATALVATATPNFTNTGAMTVPHVYQTATLLPDGKVLAAAGASHFESSPCIGCATYSYTLESELFSPASGLWRKTGPLNVARMRQTATLLTNGNVLVAGGVGNTNNGNAWGYLSSAEVYHSDIENWFVTGELNLAREFHTATLLPNGKVLVAGGDTGGLYSDTRSAELYDSATGLWTNTGFLNVARHAHTATLLPSGKVLVTGGSGSLYVGDGLSSAELYDSVSQGWTHTYPMSTNRVFHTATLLADGRVLIAGGLAYLNDFGNHTIYSSAEIYNPATEIWTPTSPMNVARFGHAATLLPNGKVLVTGGEAYDGTNQHYAIFSAELYDSATGIWTQVGAMNDAREYHTATLLTNGVVLLAGGLGTNSVLLSTEIFDPNVLWNPPVTPAAALGIGTYSNQPAVFFPTGANVNHLLQMCTDLNTSNWVTVSNGIPISGVIITNPPVNVFFRLY